MGLTKLAIKRPVSVLIVVLALIIFGASSMVGAPLELTPDMEMPMLLVQTVYGGAGPEEIEDLVTRPLENTVSTLSGVKNITSYSRENVSMMLLELNYGTDMDVAHMDLQEKLNMIKNQLPDDASSPIIIEMSMDMMPSVILSASATGDVDLLNIIDDEVTPEFEKLGGVASVSVSGGRQKYISIRLKEDKLRQYKLDMTAVANVVGNADFSIPAGTVDRGDSELALRGGVTYSSPEQLKSIPITLSGGQVIHLADVADVLMTTEPAGSVSRYNGEDTVMITVTKRQSASTVDMTQSVIREVEKINSRNLGVQMSVIMDSSTDIISSIKTVASTLILGIILSMLVLFIFFGDFKASLIVASSMPLSVLCTMILMNAMGFSFNVVSLGGLVIGVGMMVDNSIVVIESCFRSRDQQRDFRDSALEGTKLVTMSIIASTLTTVVVYLPISVMQGMSGQLFRQLGFTIIFSLSCSLISAMTLVPLLFMKVKPMERKGMWMNKLLTKVQRGYGSFVKKTLRVKPLVVIVSILLLVGSFAIAAGIPFQLMPDMDQGQISISVDTKPGLKIEKVDSILRDLEVMVQDCPDLDRYSSSGGSGSSMMGSGSASLTVYLKGDREKSTKEWVDAWREQTKDSIGYTVSVSASSMMSSMSGGGGIDVNLQGNDLDALREASKDVETMMLQNPDVIKVSSTVSSGDPQVEVNVDPIKAAAVGLTPKQVVGMVYNVMSGNSPDSLLIDGREYDMKVEFPDDRYQTISDLSGLMLTVGGRQVPLLDIATLEYSNAPQSIDRKNGQYIVTVTATPTTAAELTAPTQIREGAAALKFPEGVSISQNDADEQMMEEFGSLFGAIATAILLVFMVMAMQFESLKFSFMVMLCIPFSLIGSFLLMRATGSTLSMPALMGFLTLVGTVINNGILFVDTANQYRSSMDAETAVITAGRIRLRPILMTTLTTILAMVPMGLGIGDGSEIMQGMAVVIIGGLTASTILSLLLLPTFYLLFDSRKRKKHQSPDPLVPPEAPNDDFSVEDLMQS